MIRRARVVHPAEEVLRRVAHGGSVEAGEREHVEGCARCRDDVAFLRALSEAAASAARGACPDALRLSLLAHRDAEAAGDAQLQAHVLRCAACAVTLESLEGAIEATRKRPMSIVQAPKRVAAAGRDLAARLAALVTLDMPPSLAHAVRGAADEVEDSTKRGLGAYRKGRFDDARAELRAAVDQGARQPEVWLLLAACDLRAGDVASALPLLQRAARARSREATYRWYLAQALLLEGNAGDAERQLARVAKMPGSHAAAARELGAAVKRLREGN